MLALCLGALPGLFTACGGGDEPLASSDSAASDGSDADEGQEEESTETGASDSLPDPGAFADLCLDAPILVPGLHPGALRGREDELDGACGLGGPQVFFSVDLDSDADLFVTAHAESFVPRIELLRAACEPGYGYQCRDASPATLYGVRGGTRIVGSVGIDPLDPALEAMEGQDADPLVFELEIDIRPIYGEGEPCGANTIGRCDGGLTCEIAPDGYERCAVLLGDTCARALSVELPAPGAVTELDLDLTGEPGKAGDRHQHSCGGLRSRDWVYRIDRLALESLAALPGEHRVELSSSQAGLSAALRGPGCISAAERACAEEISLMPLSLDPEQLIAGPDGDTYLIVELPQEGEGVISLALAVVDA